jgi:N-acetylglucosaminyl-diphospho-decaprenol L-rhamnosyltransferase
VKHIAVIIVNYKTGTLVAESLARLATARSGGVDLRVVVVDNHSPDDSLTLIGQAIDQLGAHTWCDLVAHGHNGGFAAGNNVGLRRVSTLNWPVDHYFLLNPDACIQPDTLPELLGFMAGLPRPAVLGCVQINEAGTPRPSSFRFPSLVSEFQRGASLGVVERLWPRSRVAMPVPTRPEQADWVTGAAFLVPKAIVEQVGLMDEGFFLYYEEVAYMHQIRAAGHEIWCVPSAKITHLAGASTGIVTGRAKARRLPVYWYRSWRRYFQTIHGTRSMWACGVAWLAGHAIHRMLSLVVSRRRTTGGPSSADFIRYALLNRPDT